MRHKCWPLHPQPMEGEALSSWLERVASQYDLFLDELMKYELGYEISAWDLDFNPPMALLKSIAQRSTLSFDQVYRMTFRSWVPFIADHLSPEINFFETYVFQYSVLLPVKFRGSSQLTDWYPWLSGKPVLRACLECLRTHQTPFIRLAWKLPLMLSCPLHGCRLQVCTIYPSYYVSWHEEKAITSPLSNTALNMDKLTWQALMMGEVNLPNRVIHAGVWFRLLRSVLNELSLPLCAYRTHSSTIKSIWEKCGYPIRGGLHSWRPYEYLSLDIQIRLLEGVATALDMIREKEISPRAQDTKLFSPEPLYEDDLRSSLTPPAKSKDQSPWPSVMEALELAVADARVNRESARQLYFFCLFGRKDPDSIREINSLFSELGIPFTFE